VQVRWYRVGRQPARAGQLTSRSTKDGVNIVGNVTQDPQKEGR